MAAATLADIVAGNALDVKLKAAGKAGAAQNDTRKLSSLNKLGTAAGAILSYLFQPADKAFVGSQLAQKQVWVAAIAGYFLGGRIAVSAHMRGGSPGFAGLMFGGMHHSRPAAGRRAH